MTPDTTTKLVRAAAAVLVLAVAPDLAAAETAERSGDALKLTLGSIPGTVLDTAETARAAGGRGEVGSFWLGGTLGPQFGTDYSAFRFTLEMQATLAQLGPRVYFDLAGHVGFILGSFGFGNLDIIEFIPAARFRFLLPDERLSLYADIGLGPAFAVFSYPAFTFASVTYGWGNFRMAGGIQFKVTPTIALWAEPVGLNVYFGTGSEFMYSMAFGALFRI